MTNEKPLIKKLISKEHGYYDYDIIGHPTIKRACVPFAVKNRCLFNVYCKDGSKRGCVWIDDLETSLRNWTS